MQQFFTVQWLREVLVPLRPTLFKGELHFQDRNRKKKDKWVLYKRNASFAVRRGRN